MIRGLISSILVDTSNIPFMKIHSLRRKLIIPVVIGGAALLTYHGIRKTLLIEPTEFEASQLSMLEEYNGKTAEGLAEMPKYDRPDLALLLDLEKTKDPRLGYVPENAPLQAYNEVQKHLSILQEKAIPGVAWNERGPNDIGGRTRALMWDPNTANKVWAGGVAGGLWYNNDVTTADSIWYNVDDFWANMAVTCIAFDPSNTNTFYVGTGEGWFNIDAVRGAGIWKTTDGGATWTQLPSTDNSNFYRVQKIAVTNSGAVLAATRTGLYRSTNGGTSWSTIINGARMADIEVAANGDVYASQGIFNTGFLFKSTDDGASFSDVTPATGANRIEIGVAPNNANIVYAVGQEAGANGVNWFYRSADAGASWSAITVPNYLEQSCIEDTNDFSRGQGWYNLILAVDPNNSDEVIVGGISHHKSNDGGTTWTPISYWTGNCETYVHADQHAIVTNPNNPNAGIVGSDGGVSYAPDMWTAAKPAFSDRNNGYNVTQFYSADTRNIDADNYIITGAQDNGSLVLNGNGIVGSTEVTGGDGAFSHIDQDNPDIQITAFTRSSYSLSRNGGASFTPILINRSFGLFINPTDYDDDTNLLYCAANANQYIFSTDLSNSSGFFLATVDFGGGQVSAVTVSPNTPNRVFFGAGGEIFRVDSAHLGGGSIVTNISNGNTSSGNVSSIAIGSSDDQLLVTYSNYNVNSVFETENGGATWTNKEGDLANMPVRWALYNPNNTNEALLATELGVWSTDDLSAASVEWGATNIGLSNVRTDMLKYRPADGQVTVATHGRGVFTGFPFSSEPPSTTELLVQLSLDSCSSTAVFDNVSGSIIGTTSGATYTAGYNGRGLFFDGTNDYVNLGANSSLELGSEFSFSMWVNTTKVGDQVLLVRNPDGSNYSWNFRLSNGQPQIILGGTDTPGPYNATSTVNDGNWHQIGVTVATDSIRFYVDGVRSGQHPAPTGSLNVNATSEVWLGMRADKPNSRQFAGMMDEVNVFSGRIEDAEMATLSGLVLNPANCTPSALVSYFTMDDCNSTTLTPSTAGAAAGALQGNSTAGIGFVNQAIFFDGVNSSAELNDDTYTPGANDAISYSFWVYPENATGNREVMLMRNEASASVFITLNNLTPEVFLGGLDNPQFYASSSPLTQNAWNHLGVTYADGVLRMFINGNQVMEQTGLTGSLTFTSTGEHFIGARADGGRPFQGGIDELRIFNEQLLPGMMASEFTRVTAAGVGCPDLLAGAWLFDNCSSPTAIDSLGLNDGTISGASRVAGFQGPGMSFDGINDFVNLGASSDFEFSDTFTIAFWVNTNQSASFKTLLAKNRLGNSFSYQVLLNNGIPSMTLGGTQNAGPYNANASIADGTWHHVAWVLTEGTLRVYIDGAEDASFTGVSGSINANAGAELWIGNRNDKTDRGFSGTLDELRIFSNALDQGTIAQLAGAAQNSTDCIGTIPALDLSMPDAFSVIKSTVYPNPNTGQFTLDLSSQDFDSQVNIEIVNALGQVMKAERVPSGTVTLPIHLPLAQPGVYYLRIHSGSYHEIVPVRIQ